MLSTVAVNSVGNMVSPCHTPLLMLSYCFLCVGGLSLSYWCRYPLGVRWTHLLSPVLEARLVLLEFALSQKKFVIVDEYDTEWDIIFSALLLQLIYYMDVVCQSICFWIQLALVAGFRQVSSLAFLLVFLWVLYRCLIVDKAVCNSWKLSPS